MEEKTEDVSTTEKVRLTLSKYGTQENKMSNLPWEIESALDEYERAVDKNVSAHIDAACRRTARDWLKAREAKEKMREKREELEQIILKEIECRKVG